MNKLIDIIRLVLTTPLSNGQIATAMSVAKNTVRRYRQIVRDQGLVWDQVEAMEPADLNVLFNRKGYSWPGKRLPDFESMHEELQRTGVTQLLLWEEYRAASPADALSYSQFTHHYRRYARTLRLSMRQMHVPGQRAFVDYSGKRPHYYDPKTGERVPVELFVGALGYSHLIYATCTPSQALSDWIASNVSMLMFFGGSPAIIVPDNLRSAVTRAGREPLINRSYQDFARHFGIAILPARPRRPKDKGKVEVAVQLAQRWILARLRNRQFFSLAELNKRVSELVWDLNHRPFKRLPGCRQSRFDDTEKAALRPLPREGFEFAEWTAPQQVPPDYHVAVQGHWYSVPHHLVGAIVEARITTATVEIFHEHLRVASHIRNRDSTKTHTTNPDHQPPQHRAYAERTPEAMIAWAEHIGPATAAVVRHQFERAIPMLGLPASDNLRGLARRFGDESLEAAAQRALEIRSPTVKSIRSLLQTGRYRCHADAHAPESSPVPHVNVRGTDFYAKKESGSC